MPIDLTPNNLEETLNGKGLVIVDFWSTTCGPCRMYSNILGWVSNENPSVKICKLNVDDYPELASKYGISSVPVTIFFHNGEEKERLVGMQPKCKLNTKIKEYNEDH